MSNGLLYSANTYLKLHIQEMYAGDIHYVWCSENFDSRALGRYSAGALVAPSSNPADIYKELKRDVNGRDKHSAKIAAQKLSFAKVAVDWEAAGKIDATARDEIIYITESAPFELWRPLIYVIPRSPVESRLQSVHPSKRAGLGPEFIIADLQRSEFDLIEL